MIQSPNKEVHPPTLLKKEVIVECFPSGPPSSPVIPVVHFCGFNFWYWALGSPEVCMRMRTTLDFCSSYFRLSAGLASMHCTLLGLLLGWRQDFVYAGQAFYHLSYISSPLQFFTSLFPLLQSLGSYIAGVCFAIFFLLALYLWSKFCHLCDHDQKCLTQFISCL